MSRSRVTHVFLGFLYLSSELRLLRFQFPCAFQLFAKLKQRKKKHDEIKLPKLAIIKNRFSISFVDYLKEPDFAYLVANNLVFLLRSL